jgi:hypothetical protein
LSETLSKSGRFDEGADKGADKVFRRPAFGTGSGHTLLSSAGLNRKKTNIFPLMFAATAISSKSGSKAGTCSTT